MNISKKFILIIPCLIIYGLLSSQSNAKSERFPFFNDVPASHQNFSAITRLETLGILNGYSDGTFKPDTAVSRVETLKILFLGSNISVDTSLTKSSFADVPIDQWYSPYVRVAQQKKIVKGDASGNFLPTTTVNLAEALKLIFLVNNFSSLSTPQEKIFNDVSADQWFAQYFLEAKKRNFFPNTETDENINPGKLLTRGELAELMYRFQKSEEKTIKYERTSFNFSTSPYNNLPFDSWEGIKLDNDIFPVLRTYEVAEFKGESDSEFVTGVITFSSPVKKISNTVKVHNGKFSLPLYISQKGKFTIGFYQGKSGTFKILNGVSTDGGENISSELKALSPKNIQTAFTENTLQVSWEKNGNDIFLLEFFQHGKYKKIFSKESSVSIPSQVFTDFQKGTLFITLKGAKSEDKTGINIDTQWSEFISTVIPIYNNFPEIRDFVDVKNITSEYEKNISFSAEVSSEKKDIQLYVTDGNENLYTKEIEREDNIISGNFSPKTKDFYLLELVDSEGLALGVFTITPKGFFPIIPLPESKEVKDSNTKLDSIKRINTFRSSHSRSQLIEDEAITQLAQIRADDMVSKNYFSHTTKNGKTVNDFRIDLGVKVPLSENIATSFQGALAASQSLEFSLTHRDNLLKNSHTRMGIGIAKDKEGKTILVQLFGGNPANEENIASTQKEIESLLEEKFPHIEKQEILSTASSKWSEVLAQKNESALEFSSGESWKSVLDSYKIQRNINIYIAGFPSLERVKEFINTKEKEEFSGKKFYGVSIAVSDQGLIFIVMLASD